MPSARHGSMTSFVVEDTAPLLDREGVEAARVLRAARSALASSEPAVTYALLAEARGQKEPTVRQWVTRLRGSRRMITVDFGGSTLIPAFQFDDVYDVIPEVARLVGLLTEAGMSGWAVWRWFCVVSPWTEKRPVDLVADGRFGELGVLAAKLVGEKVVVTAG